MKAFHLFLIASLAIHSAWGKEGDRSEVKVPQRSASTGKIAEGTKWETNFHVIDSGVPGPTVLIVGGMHGNEPAGSRAAEQIANWPIVKGKVVLVPRANVPGLKANMRSMPGEPKDAANLNRNFTPAVDGANDTVAPRGELAGALWRFAMKVKPDWVIDLHEGFEFHRSHKPQKGKERSVGSSVIYRGGPEMDPLAKRIVAAADGLVTVPERRFSLLRKGPVDTGLARACINVMGAEGLILETTFKDQPLSLRTRQHRAMANVVLNHIGVIEEDCSERLADEEDGRLQVAIFDGKGTGPTQPKVGGVVKENADMQLYEIGAAEMRPEILGQFDVVVFPGGSGSKQAGDIGEGGRAAVKDFVRKGGGVVGVCAGAYLCSSHYKWSLGLIDSAVLTGAVEIPGKGRKQLWYRGREAGIDLELTPAGESLFAAKGIPRDFEVRYCNGPIISPKGLDALDDYRVLAWFRSENGLWDAQKGTMVDTPAIVSGSFGKGRVLSVSPHPELTPELHPILAQGIRWAGGTVE